MAAGARAVQIGTASFIRPNAMGEILNELSAWCDSHGYADINDLVGAVRDDDLDTDILEAVR